METTCSRCERDESGSSAADDQRRWGSCRGNGDSTPPPRRDAPARPAPTALACSDHLRAGILRDVSKGCWCRAFGSFTSNLRGRSVLLKPNLVEYIAGVEVNTNPVLVGAAARGISQAGRRQRRSRRGSWAPARHVSGARRERARSSTAQPEDQLRRSEPRRTVQSANEGHLHGSRSPVAASDCAHVRLRRVDAEDQDPPLGWRHARA